MRKTSSVAEHLLKSTRRLWITKYRKEGMHFSVDIRDRLNKIQLMEFYFHKAVNGTDLYVTKIPEEFLFTMNYNKNLIYENCYLCLFFKKHGSPRIRLLITVEDESNAKYFFGIPKGYWDNSTVKVFERTSSSGYQKLFSEHKEEVIIYKKGNYEIISKQDFLDAYEESTKESGKYWKKDIFSIIHVPKEVIVIIDNETGEDIHTGVNDIYIALGSENEIEFRNKKFVKKLVPVNKNGRKTKIFTSDDEDYSYGFS